MEKFKNEMTQEEMKKEFEARKAEWENFIKDLKDNPNETITKAELLKIVDFISENIGGFGQIISLVMHNMDVLNHNFEQIVTLITNGKPGIIRNKTQSGIIIP